MPKVTCSEFSNVQGYGEGMTGYMISAVKFHEMLITKPCKKYNKKFCL